MSAHVKAAARERYALELTDEDIESMRAQCLGRRSLIRTFSDDGAGRPSEHHEVVVRGVKMLAIFKRGMISTVLPRGWLRNDDQTAMSVALRKAGLR
jgi:hypothetical protein